MSTSSDDQDGIGLTGGDLRRIEVRCGYLPFGEPDDSSHYTSAWHTLTAGPPSNGIHGNFEAHSQFYVAEPGLAAILIERHGVTIADNSSALQATMNGQLGRGTEMTNRHQIVRMTKATTSPTPTTFNAAFCAVTKLARQSLGWTQNQMATALDIPEDRYRKYEVRSPMPHELLPRFAQITGRSVHDLFTNANARALHNKRAA